VVRRFEKGIVTVNHNKFMGYTKDKTGQLIIVPEEAEVVRKIFRLYLEGKSVIQIAKALEREKIKTATGNDKWHDAVIYKMLQNEKYIGDALLQKTYTVDFLSKKRVVNNGIVPQYYVENSHEAIIPRDLYMQVQEELVRRANLRTGKNGSKRVYSSKYALSSIVFCGECGEIYRRVHWNNRGKKSIVWRCVSRLDEKSADCGSPTILESDLQNGVLKAINQAISGRDEFIGVLMKNIATVLGEEFDKDTVEIDRQLAEQQEELVSKANAKVEYDALVDEIYRLRAAKQSVQENIATRQTQRQRIAEMTSFLQEQNSEVAEYDDKLVRQLVEAVTVYDKQFLVRFKSGIEVEVG